MIRARQRKAGLGTLWARMIEAAEHTNDLVVTGQREASVRTANEIAKGADAIGALARAIVLLGPEPDDAQ